MVEKEEMKVDWHDDTAGRSNFERLNLPDLSNNPDYQWETQCRVYVYGNKKRQQIEYTVKNGDDEIGREYFVLKEDETRTSYFSLRHVNKGIRVDGYVRKAALFYGAGARVELTCVKIPKIKKEKIENELNVKLEEEFDIKLDSNASTGYSWTSAPCSKIELIDSKYYTDGSIGGSGIQKFVFKAKEKGQDELIMNYGRQWEDEIIETKIYKLNIK